MTTYETTILKNKCTFYNPAAVEEKFVLQIPMF